MARRGKAWQGFLIKGFTMKFNIDVSHVEAGDVIEKSVCEQVIGFPMEQDQYQFNFQLMQLADYVGKLLWKDGKKLTVVSRGGEVVVLTHEQASKYNDSRFELAAKKMRRCNKRLLAVNVSELPKEARESHTMSIIKQSRILQGLSQARKDLRVNATVRSVPKIRVK